MFRFGCSLAAASVLLLGCSSDDDAKSNAAAGGGGSSSGGSSSGGSSTGGSSTGGSSTGGSSSGGASGSGSGCALPNYPDETCTGVPPGTSLTVVEGDLEVNDANTVIDGKEIHGCVLVNAPGVVIRNSKISAECFLVIASYASAYTGTGLVIEDSEIDCKNTNGTAVGDTNFTARRVNVHGCENGFDIDGQVTIEDSYVHDLFQSEEAHTDAAQITPVGHDITFRHNTLYANEGTSAIISPDVSAGIVSKVLIRDNLMAGGAYTLYCQQAGGGDDYRVIDNHFSTIFSPKVGAYGPWTDCADETEVSGNVYHETGQPLPAD